MKFLVATMTFLRFYPENCHAAFAVRLSYDDRAFCDFLRRALETSCTSSTKGSN
ncbi:MAG: hypothetical protein ACI97A_004434 [Planctomycetota bacterium]|jgi:hypothetical protein